MQGRRGRPPAASTNEATPTGTTPVRRRARRTRTGNATGTHWSKGGGTTTAHGNNGLEVVEAEFEVGKILDKLPTQVEKTKVYHAIGEAFDISTQTPRAMTRAAGAGRG